MIHIAKSILFLYMLAWLLQEREPGVGLIAVLLAVIAIEIYKARWHDSVYATVTTLIMISVGIATDWRFGLLLALAMMDFVMRKWRFAAGTAFIASSLLLWPSDGRIAHWVMLALLGLLAEMSRRSVQEEARFQLTIDNERRLRYELEQSRAKLLHSSKQIASIAEVKERNRIARDIHDHVGHHLAGILIRLQAAYKLHARDEKEAMKIVGESIDGLAESVGMLRDTVHNIKARENLGVGYLQYIIDNYQFCPVELELKGDFNDIPAAHLELLHANIKEALTNAARYSEATRIEVRIETTDKYTRLLIKDNGIGCRYIHEGLGLSGMRERIRNVGGTMSIDAEQGFLIVCFIPKEEGGDAIGQNQSAAGG